MITLDNRPTRWSLLLDSSKFSHPRDFYYLRLLPAHCKNDIGPEAGSKYVFKQLDHAFQAMGEPRTLHKRMTLDCLPVKYYYILLHECPVANWLGILTSEIPVHWKGWRRRWRAWSPPSACSPTAPQSPGRPPPRLQALDQNSLLHLSAFILPGVSITVTGFPPSPFHLIHPVIEP